MPSSPARAVAPHLTRRRLLRAGVAGAGIAWVAPVVLSTPAAAQVSCASVKLDWDTFAVGTTFTSTTIGGVTVTLTVAPLSGTTLLPTNRQVFAGPAGGVTENYLRFEMQPTARGIGQIITFTFSASVSNLSVSLYDIDALEGGWRDRILINTTPFGFTFPTGSTVQGAGVAGDQFRNQLTNVNVSNTSNQGNVDLTVAGPTTSLSFRYTNGNQTGGGNQWIGFSDLTFQPC